MMYWFIATGLVIVFGLIVLRGAPYVPTRRRKIKIALDLLNLKKGDTFLDLGSGDGSVVIAAAKRGCRAIGYELNPILWAASRLRGLPYRQRATIQLYDFWLAKWPADTTAIFVFLAGPHMNHLAARLRKETAHRSLPLRVVSYGFAIPGYSPKQVEGGMYLYYIAGQNKDAAAN